MISAIRQWPQGWIPAVQRHPSACLAVWGWRYPQVPRHTQQPPKVSSIHLQVLLNRSFDPAPGVWHCCKSVLVTASEADYVKKKNPWINMWLSKASTNPLKGQGQAMILKKWKKWPQNQDSYYFILISNYFLVGIQGLLDVATLL